MAYKKEELYKKALEVAKIDGVYFIEDIVALLPCSKPTFYDYFKVDSNEINNIKDILEKNKVSKKVELRKTLSQGTKASEIISLYKLIGTDEERKKLSISYSDNENNNNNTINIPMIDWIDGSDKTK